MNHCNDLENSLKVIISIMNNDVKVEERKGNEHSQRACRH